MLVVIRVDSSVQIGIGHVMRCLTLANELRSRGAEVHFVCRDLQGNISDAIKSDGFNVSLLLKTDVETEPEKLLSYWEKDASETINAIGPRKPDWCVVDHYGIDSKWHSMLRRLAKYIFVIDDMPNRVFDCDVLMDQTYGREKVTYNANVPTHCEILLGSKFALLRPEFARLRLQALRKRKSHKGIWRILISIGGMDPTNVTGSVLEALELVNWKNIPVVDVVLGGQAPYLESITQQTRTHSLEINVLTDVSNMAELMLEADIAIGAAGTTSWERCAMGLPTAVIGLAENQKDVLHNLEKSGAHIIIGSHNSDTDINLIVDSLNRLLGNTELINRMIKSSFDVCDGLGAQRIGLKLVPCRTTYDQHLTLKKITIGDAEILYKWQRDPQTRMYANNPDIPSWETHLEWMESKITSRSSYFWMIRLNEEPAGVLRLDNSDLESGVGYLISIYISPEKYRQGIASSALEMAKRLFSHTVLYAEVFEENEASISLFSSVGFRYRKDVGYFVWRNTDMSEQ